MLNITDHHGNKNQNHNETPPNIRQEGYHQQNRKQAAPGRNYAGGPVAKTSRSQHRRPRFHLPSGNWIPQAAAKGLHTPIITRSHVAQGRLQGQQRRSRTAQRDQCQKQETSTGERSGRGEPVRTVPVGRSRCCHRRQQRSSCSRASTADVQSPSHVRLFATLWSRACQASLSFTISQSLFQLMSIASVMPSNHFILQPRNSICTYIPKRTESRVSRRYLHTCVHSSIIQSS